jgi:hypothetical protein
MMKFGVFILLLILSVPIQAAQEAIELADNTFKMKGHGEILFYYGLSQGDQLVFTFEEINGDEISQIEISEYPSNTKFMTCKAKKIEPKLINVTRTAVYFFKLKNSGFFGRVCKLKVHRIPATAATVKFNSSVYWRTVQDTIFSKTAERYLIKSDTSIQTLLDKTIKIATSIPLRPHLDKELIEFSLPSGTASWSYYIGVGSEGQRVFSKTKSGFFNSAASVATQIPGYGSMAALALYGINAFQLIQGEDNVKCALITDSKNAQLFMAGQPYQYFQQSNVLSEASQMKSPLSGKVYFGLQNDNLVEPIAVKLNVTAVVIRQKWGVIPAQVSSVTSRREPYLK